MGIGKRSDIAVVRVWRRAREREGEVNKRASGPRVRAGCGRRRPKWPRWADAGGWEAQMGFPHLSDLPVPFLFIA